MKKTTIILFLIGLSVLILVNLPIIYYYLFPKENLVFLGRRVINSQDVYTYAAFIEEAKQGKILFENLFTTDQQSPTLLRPSYLLIGKFASFLNLSGIGAYHIARVIFSVIFLIVLYKFISGFFEDPRKRIIAFMMLLTSSGLGFALKMVTPNSSDLWIPESNTFLSLAESPHFILSQILMVSGFLFFMKYLEKKKLIYVFFSTLIFLLLAFEHPLNLIIIAPTIFFTSLLSGMGLARSILFASLSSFGIIYQFTQALTNPILKSWQVEHFSPSPINYLAGFGLLIPLAVIGTEKFIKEKMSRFKLILIWAFATAVLVYSPSDFQRRMIEGAHIPLAVLATTGLFTAIEKLKKETRLLILYGSVIFLSFSSLYAVFNDMITLGKDSPERYYYYISRSESDGIEWLKNNTNANDGILSNWFFGNLIPGLTGRRVYLGHKAQSGDFYKKIELINAFLLDTDPISSAAFLKKNNINYIFLGNYDSMITYGFKPENNPALKLVYSKNEVIIYKFSP